MIKPKSREEMLSIVDHSVDISGLGIDDPLICAQVKRIARQAALIGWHCAHLINGIASGQHEGAADDPARLKTRDLE